MLSLLQLGRLPGTYDAPYLIIRLQLQQLSSASATDVVVGSKQGASQSACVRACVRWGEPGLRSCLPPSVTAHAYVCQLPAWVAMHQSPLVATTHVTATTACCPLLYTGQSVRFETEELSTGHEIYSSNALHFPSSLEICIAAAVVCLCWYCTRWLKVIKL